MDIGENSNSSNAQSVVRFVDASWRDFIQRRFSLPELRIRHHDIRANRVKDVGYWFLRTEEYRNWIHGVKDGKLDNAVLFCGGAPGVGKTYITSLVVDRLCNWTRGQDAAVACFYFDFADQKKQSPTNALGSLMKQVVGSLKEIPLSIGLGLVEGERAWERKLVLDEIIDVLQISLSSQPTFLCIDALDECMAEHRAKLLSLLKQILHKCPSTRIFLSGRLHIRDEVKKVLAGRVVAVSITPAMGDIVRFLREKVKEDKPPHWRNTRLEEEIVANIPKSVPEIFLLVSLNIKAILEEKTLHRRRKKISAMRGSASLADTYDAIIGEITRQQEDRARLGMATLMWISHSQRPLNVDELCHALAVEIGSTDIDPNNVPSIRTILDCCQGLVTVDKGTSTIRLVHLTLKEYLSDHRNLFSGPHSQMAETCLTYLNFEKIKNYPSKLFGYNRTGTLQFLEYSSLYWGTHMRIEISCCAISLALDLLCRYDNHISAKYLHRSTVDRFFYSEMPPSALHCISYFDIGGIARDLMRAKRWDVNQRDSAGMTLLMWAARYGREDIVLSLLQQGQTQPDMQDERYGRTALSWAAESGHERVVTLFFGAPFVDPGNIGRWWGITPIVMSLRFGRKYVNPDRPDRSGQTPLSWAARTGHEGVVKLLLGRGDIDPNRQDNYNRTPLSLAAQNGHEGAVEVLLGQEGIRPNQPDNYNRTPLSLAARNGHDGVVGLLLKQEDISPDRPDNDGQTPLAWAAQHGYERVVKLLLGREDVNLNKPNNLGQTPVSLAAQNMHDAVVGLLLKQEDISPNRPDNDGQTPRTWAPWHVYERVVKLLLGREDVYLNKPNNLGQTPLSLEAQNMHNGIVKPLLARNVGFHGPHPCGKGTLAPHKVAENALKPRCHPALVDHHPGFTLQKVQGFTPAEVLIWLEEISFFKEFESPDHPLAHRKAYLYTSLSGSVLLEYGHDFKWLLGFLSFGQSVRLAELIMALYRVASLQLPSNYNATSHTVCTRAATMLRVTSVSGIHPIESSLF